MTSRSRFVVPSITVRSWRRAALTFSVVGFVTSCSDPAAPAGTAVQPVIYGTDDRQDVYAHPDAMLRQLAAQSIVAQFAATSVDVSDPANVRTTGDTLAVSQNLCVGERFANDPAHSSCSGTLIDDNLVLTAGHCFTGATPAERQTACRTQRFVFGYYRDSASAMHPLTSADVFQCDNLVAWANATVGGRNLDYAIVRLDRSAAPRYTPVSVRRPVAAVAVSTPVTIIGFGSGIPAKIDTGGRVLEARAETLDYFEADTDSFAGNSGSGVFDTATRELVGILVRGATDYVMRGACNVANVCTAVDRSTAACAGESVNYPQPALAELCAGAGSARLCATTATDGGVPADAAPPVDAATPADAGTVTADAGTVTADAGTVTADTGTVTADTGTVTADTGTVTEDAGATADAGAAVDTGAAAPAPASDGGCSVAAGRKPGDSGLLAGLGAVMAALWLRRRR